MPWCEDCGRFYSQPTLSTEGDCPQGHHVADPTESGLRQSQAADESDQVAKVPWHFWLLLIALAIYLGWRLIQLVVWLFS